MKNVWFKSAGYQPWCEHLVAHCKLMILNLVNNIDDNNCTTAEYCFGRHWVQRTIHIGLTW